MLCRSQSWFGSDERTALGTLRLAIPNWWGVFADSMSSSMIQLQVGQSIRAADASLLASGWLPQPDQSMEGLEQDSSEPALPALSSCSGTGVGFCRYDYARDRQRLSVVTVPSPSPDPS